MVTKVCACCSRPKNINQFNRTQWNLPGNYRKCGECIRNHNPVPKKVAGLEYRRTMKAAFCG